MLSTRQKAEVRNFTVCWQPATTSASALLLLLLVWPRPGTVMQSVMPSVMPHSIHYGGKCKRHKQHRTTSACPLSVHTHIRRRVRVQVHDSATKESTGYTRKEGEREKEREWRKARETRYHERRRTEERSRVRTPDLSFLPVRLGCPA